MADADKATLEKVKKLYEALRENQAKGYELLEEIGRVLGGEPGIGALLKEAERAFETGWRSRYPGGYIWRYTSDRPQMKRLLKVLTVEEIAARSVRFITNDDPFFVKGRHSFGMFVATINQHTAAADFNQVLPPTDCKHRPHCKTEADCTRRGAADLRA